MLSIQITNTILIFFNIIYKNTNLTIFYFILWLKYYKKVLFSKFQTKTLDLKKINIIILFFEIKYIKNQLNYYKKS